MPPPSGPNDPGPALDHGDVRAVAAWSYQTLAPFADADWTRRAGDLEWTCRQTLEHLIFALDRYSVHLATPLAEAAPRPSVQQPHLSPGELLKLMARRAGVLAAVVAASAPTDRGSHPFGLADSIGFVAIACVETLVHTDDISRGFGQTCQPPEALCRRILARLAPWAPTNVDAWCALRWATGRIDLPGHPRTPPNWAWQIAPLAEWDGTVKTYG